MLSKLLKVNVYVFSLQKMALGELSVLHTLFLENETQINKTNHATMFFMSKQFSLPKKALDPAKINIGTQSVQELFFCDRRIRRTVYSNDSFKFIWLRCTARKKLGIYDVHKMLHR